MAGQGSRVLRFRAGSQTTIGRIRISIRAKGGTGFPLRIHAGKISGTVRQVNGHVVDERSWHMQEIPSKAPNLVRKEGGELLAVDDDAERDLKKRELHCGVPLVFEEAVVGCLPQYEL